MTISTRRSWTRCAPAATPTCAPSRTSPRPTPGITHLTGREAWGLANAQVNLVYTYNTSYSNVEYAYTESSPICVALLDGYWDNGTDFMRNHSWWALSSGSRGHHYGNAGSISYTQAGFISDLATDTDGINQGTYWGIFEGFPGTGGSWSRTRAALVTAGRGTHRAPIASERYPVHRRETRTSPRSRPGRDPRGHLQPGRELPDDHGQRGADERRDTPQSWLIPRTGRKRMRESPPRIPSDREFRWRE